MMAVVAIDSLKNLPSNALYGSYLIFYYGLAIVTFFIPSALVSAELATIWPVTGGAYIWVREIFNKQTAFMTVWMQWLVAIIWYPSILSFIAATLAYLFLSDLALSKLYIVITIQLLFWGALLLVSRGLRLTSLVSTLSAIIGVIIPMLFMIVLSACWIYGGKLSQLNLLHALQTESVMNADSLRLFITLLYSLMGMELLAVHAGDVKNPQKQYPLAVLLASLIILATVIPSSLAITIVVPHSEISLTTGIIEAFIIFLKAFHLEWMQSALIISLAAGSFGIFLTWLLASTRYLQLAAQDGCLPLFLQKTNRFGMPTHQLLTQGIIFSILSTTFIFMPSVNSAFWFLSVGAAQFALLYYLFLFAAAWYLITKHPQVKGGFYAAKSPLIFQALCIIGFITCAITFAFGFLPPPEIEEEQALLYELTLGGILTLGCGIGLLIYKSCQSKVIDLALY